jgi:CBS domain-containing protein
MKVRDVMTTAVTTLRSDTPIQAAAATLVSHGHTAAPVVDSAGALVGVVSEADLVRGRIMPEGWQVEVEPEAVVAAVMSHGVIGATPEDDLADIVARMLDEHLRAMPVLDEGRIVGIVTRRDVLRLVAHRQLLSEQAWTARTAMASNDRG